MCVCCMEYMYMCVYNQFYVLEYLHTTSILISCELCATVSGSCDTHISLGIFSLHYGKQILLENC